LESAGCDRIKSEKASGKAAARAELKRPFAACTRTGGYLGCLQARPAGAIHSDLLKFAEELDKLGASLEVLNTNLDTVLYHSELVEYQASRWH
jgi:DNA invertase Pin-like site-specific DNA recombinase